MAYLRCKMCGGDLNIQAGSSVATCEFCGTQQTIPTVNDDLLQGLFNRANVLRMKSEFDKAADIYEKILQSDPDQAEAYWGLILCKYGVEYVEDPKSLRRIPTCHRTSYDAITADEDFKNALRCADAVQRRLYEAEAAAIDAIQKGILAISQKEEPYDVFLCYKETDASGKRTVDSTIANDIYYQLTQEGFKVFFAAITLEDKLGTEYEPYIFSALNTAKVMLVLGTRPEHFGAVWVKNEWSRFLKLMKQDRSRRLIPCYRDMDAYELPEEFAHLQAQDMSKIGFINDVVRGIKKIVVKEPVAPAPAAQAAAPAAVPQAAPAANVTALLDRGNMALEDQQWDKANEYFDQVLNLDARCGEAFLGMLLAENKVSNLNGFVESRIKQYSGKKPSRVMHEACELAVGTFGDAVGKYTVQGFFGEEDIAGLFGYERTYWTESESRQADLEKEQGYAASDKLLNRARKFLGEKGREELNSAVAKIHAELRTLLKLTEEKDEKRRRTVASEYENHIRQAVSEVKEKAKEAKAQRDALYEKLVADQENAQFYWDFDKVAEQFERLGDYKDAEERAVDCWARARIKREDEKVREEKEKKRKIIMISAAILAVLILAFTVSTVTRNNKINEVKRMLIGQTFTGTYRYHGSSRDYVTEVTVKIIDDKYCSVKKYEYEERWGDRSDERTVSDSKATYTVTLGPKGITFNWDSSKAYHSAEPYTVTIDGTSVKMHTNNFNSRVGMDLKGYIARPVAAEAPAP